jgi:tetratricopeptide (TPR) repeat protein
VWAPALDAAEAAALRALRLDPRLAAAEVALGNVYRDRWDWEQAETHYLRALEIDPDDAEAHQQYGEMLAAMGREDLALRSARRAVALDPTAAIRINVLGYILLLNDRPEEAIAQAELAAVHGPELHPPYQNQARTYLYLGDIDRAERLEREEVIPRLGFDADTERMWDEAVATRYEAFRTGDVDAYDRCCRGRGPPSDYLVLGYPERAIEALRERYEDRPRFNSNTLRALWWPNFDPIRDDPVFQQVLEEILDYAGLSGAELRRAPPGA